MRTDQPDRQHTVGVPCSAHYGSVFNEREEKLIRLGLDPAAAPGEVANSGAKLLQSLRKRGVGADTLILAGQAKMPASPQITLEDARRRVMPFGKHRGRQLEAIEPSYLRWALRECSCPSLGLREAIKIVLRGGVQ